MGKISLCCTERDESGVCEAAKHPFNVVKINEVAMQINKYGVERLSID